MSQVLLWKLPYFNIWKPALFAKYTFRLNSNCPQNSTDGALGSYQRVGKDIHYVFDAQWPLMNHPSPVQIFGIENVSRPFNKQTLASIKKKYLNAVKIYHPDVSNNIRVYRTKAMDKSNLLSDEEKLERFNLISSSKSILTNPKASLYDNNWPNTFNENFEKDYKTMYQQGRCNNPQYWEAGTWEDKKEAGSNTENNMQRSKDGRLFFITIIGLIICFKGTDLMTQVQDSILKNPEKILKRN
ncbi:hypothetical protein TPHA_0A03650 [Tetrapisispora phaffii CBS 4417]|uniref:J domain-containing protein n=1 Tax=Tetrapisispora phaffii (strain ATCC 24235 / CBS 4417 / NBRC 1672 / NRRL Y-8282 / UCD 70-5) TaxID=1071381 RepID=G8BNG3_TETPH|nr:hypothetical protein TPHA_0A03650 [Tetrapisispora phaffii CBS 4417]CCE61441.1 hypothetical protein TPHA_0A03650 [Tetrapisispora phaffii CBS 4417]